MSEKRNRYIAWGVAGAAVRGAWDGPLAVVR